MPGKATLKAEKSIKLLEVETTQKPRPARCRDLREAVMSKPREAVCVVWTESSKRRETVRVAELPKISESGKFQNVGSDGGRKLSEDRSVSHTSKFQRSSSFRPTSSSTLSINNGPSLRPSLFPAW
ncbi:hypothetical protein J6590_008330 [Homalodisca vitripennis]|nr:hypothetical protein J6590_008330 [Homalodisca vitripennis]